MDTRFIRVLQEDIVTKPEEWKNAAPGKFIKLSDRAKNVYCVLSVVAFSSAVNARGQWVKKGHRLNKDWFWTSHSLLQQLTGSSQKTVQRGIKELKEAGFIGYHPSKAQNQKCFFRITRVKYNESYDKLKLSESKGSNIPEPVKNQKRISEEPTLPPDEPVIEEPQLPDDKRISEEPQLPPDEPVIEEPILPDYKRISEEPTLPPDD